MLTKKLKKRIKDIEDCEIKDFLLNFSDDSYEEIDISNFKNDYISYLEKGKGKKIRKKVGKFIRKHTKDFSPREIEVFVNKFKSSNEFNKVKENFQLVDGKKIIWGYSSNNYANRSGSLGSSCMNNREKSQYGLYVNNPEKIKLLVLTDKNDKILARALVWKGIIRIGNTAEERNKKESRKKVIVVDRVYSSNEYQNSLFEEYAAQKDWLVKRNQMQFKTPDGEIITGRFKSKLKKANFSSLPYIDTMRYISKKGSISNKVWANLKR